MISFAVFLPIIIDRQNVIIALIVKVVTNLQL